MILYTEIAVLAIIMILATIAEVRTGEIKQFIWLTGGLIGFVYNFFGVGFCSFKESIITLAGSFVIVIIAKSRLTRMMGGGIIKGIMMDSIFLGWKTVFGFAAFLAVVFIYSMIREHRYYDSLPGENVIFAMPILDIAMILNVAVILWLM